MASRADEIELDLSEIESTGSYTPIFQALPPPPRLPSLPPVPAPIWLPAPAPRPRGGRGPASGATWTPTAPRGRAAPHEITRPDIVPTRSAPSTLPPAARRTLLETRSPSMAPASWTLPPPPPRALRVARPTRAVGLGVGAGVVLFLCAWLAAAPTAASARTASVVTATDSRGLALRDVHVLVDGRSVCAATPCSIELEPGAHQIDVIDSTTDQRAGRSLSVGKGERAVVHFALPTGPTSRAATPAPLPPTEAPISVNELAREEVGETPPPENPRAAPAAPPRAAGAWLNLNSIPISNVVLDGRPIGSTPLTGVAVSPGKHAVAFVHPELGRRGGSIEIGTGERKAVVVRFERGRGAAE
ncbi:MAG: hypothetical protein HYZ29_11450 [Myxococcales bacterium]|nr:hypothetical protein [Myxococcales bacterium]